MSNKRDKSLSINSISHHKASSSTQANTQYNTAKNNKSL